MSRRLIDPRIKLRHIACFLEVARLRSVTAAADALAISQPAVSKTVQELEDLLGAALFDRSRRTLVFTPFGEVFHRYAATGMVALRQGIDAANQTGRAATLKVGALPTVSVRILPRAVEIFSAGSPGVRTHIVTGPNDYLISVLRTGDVDLVIGRMTEPDAMGGLTFEHLYSERVVMVVRPDHPLLGERAFHLGMIEDYQTLMPTPDSLIRRLVDRLLLTNGVTQLRDEVATVSSDFGRAYVRRTNAVWIISEGVVASDVAEGQLALLPVDTGETLGPVGFTSRTDTQPTLAVTGFMEAVRQVAASIG
ncbi:pca operon transcription factor PcaQ [Pseudochelatococcus sp. B33]